MHWLIEGEYYIFACLLISPVILSIKWLAAIIVKLYITAYYTWHNLRNTTNQKSKDIRMYANLVYICWKGSQNKSTLFIKIWLKRPFEAHSNEWYYNIFMKISFKNDHSWGKWTMTGGKILPNVSSFQISCISCIDWENIL